MLPELVVRRAERLARLREAFVSRRRDFAFRYGATEYIAIPRLNGFRPTLPERCAGERHVRDTFLETLQNAAARHAWSKWHAACRKCGCLARRRSSARRQGAGTGPYGTAHPGTYRAFDGASSARLAFYRSLERFHACGSRYVGCQCSGTRKLRRASSRLRADASRNRERGDLSAYAPFAAAW